MAINFPDTPEVDQAFTSGDKTWKWTGTRWEIVVVGATGGSIPSIEVSSDTTLDVQTKHFVDTSASRTLTLPDMPNIGDEVFIYDAFGLASTNNIIVLRNGNKINGLEDDAIIDIDQSTSSFTYTGITLGWRFD